MTVHIAVSIKIHINPTKMIDSNAITFPVVNSLLSAVGVKREIKVEQPGQLRKLL